MKINKLNKSSKPTKADKQATIAMRKARKNGRGKQWSIAS